MIDILKEHESEVFNWQKNHWCDFQEILVLYNYFLNSYKLSKIEKGDIYPNFKAIMQLSADSGIKPILYLSKRINRIHRIAEDKETAKMIIFARKRLPDANNYKGNYYDMLIPKEIEPKIISFDQIAPERGIIQAYKITFVKSKFMWNRKIIYVWDVLKQTII